MLRKVLVLSAEGGIEQEFRWATDAVEELDQDARRRHRVSVARKVSWLRPGGSGVLSAIVDDHV